jgi:hypothetical protein
MWATAGVALLLTWLVVATGTAALVFVRRLKRNGMPQGLSNPDQPFLSSIFGRMPRTPRPESADCDTDSEDSEGQWEGAGEVFISSDPEPDR